ncbi:MAG: hypothetical protein AAGK04_08160 [Planctomycetota bacterium]
MNERTLRLAFVTVLACAAGIGCRGATEIMQGDARPVMVTFFVDTAEAYLDPAIEPRAALAAGELALRDHGYSVVERELTDERGEIQGERPGARFYEAIWISSRGFGDATRVRVKARPGDEARQRLLMDGLLQRLGH